MGIHVSEVTNYFLLPNLDVKVNLLEVHCILCKPLLFIMFSVATTWQLHSNPMELVSVGGGFKQ